MANLSVAVVGCGHWGQNLLRNFFDLGVLYSVSDDDVGRAQSFAKKYSCKQMPFADVLEDKTIDGIVLATPAKTHADLAVASLEAGKHVFVEKPLAMDLEEGKKIKTASQVAGKIIMVGHLLQYHPAFEKLKEIVHEGELGKIRFIQAIRTGLGIIRNEEDVLWSLAPHDISMVLSLAGARPKKVTARGSCISQEHIPDNTTVFIDFEHDVAAQIFVSWFSAQKEQKLTVIGEKKMAVFDDRLPWGEKLSVVDHELNCAVSPPAVKKNPPTFLDVAEGEPLRKECEYFCNCIRGKVQGRTDIVEGLDVVSVLEQASISLKSGGM